MKFVHKEPSYTGIPVLKYIDIAVPLKASAAGDLVLKAKVTVQQSAEMSAPQLRARMHKPCVSAGQPRVRPQLRPRARSVQQISCLKSRQVHTAAPRELQMRLSV